jgi:hypothetical protein
MQLLQTSEPLEFYGLRRSMGVFVMRTFSSWHTVPERPRGREYVHRLRRAMAPRQDTVQYQTEIEVDIIPGGWEHAVPFSRVPSASNMLGCQYLMGLP